MSIFNVRYRYIRFRIFKSRWLSICIINKNEEYSEKLRVFRLFRKPPKGKGNFFEAQSPNLQICGGMRELKVLAEESA